MLSADTHLLFKSYLDEELENGPYEQDYLKLTEWMFRVNRENANKEDVKILFPKSLWVKDYGETQSLFNRIFNAGRVVGNYAIMQDLYTGYVNEKLSEHDQRWDTYIQSQISSVAVRHRVHELRESLQRFDPHSVLDVACGSGIGAYICAGYLARCISYVGVDSDKNAVKYCVEQYQYRSSLLRFYQRNLRELNPETSGTFDLVWCSGLFDYFSSDIVFMRAAKILLEMSNATVVIGNMGPANMTVPMMNLLGWKLNYRTKNHLKQLAQDIQKKYGTFKTYEVTSDPTGIQHYLYLYK